MKKSIFIMTAIMLLSIVSIHAATPELDRPKPAKAIVVQIYSMLGENSIPNEIRGFKAEVRVAIDKGNYLRILSIETENEALENFIRESVDFQKLSKGTYRKGIVYRIPLEVRK